MDFAKLPLAERIVPHYNIGGIIDVILGSITYGPDGEGIFNSGAGTINSVIGPQNSFKTALLMFIFYTVMSRYGCSQLVYDTENSLTYTRLKKITDEFPELADLDYDSPELMEHIRLIYGSSIYGDELFEIVKEQVALRVKNKKEKHLTTPFSTFGGGLVTVPPIVQLLIDSISQMKISAVESNIVDKVAAGDSKANTQFMKEAAGKAQILTQLPNVTARGGIMVGMVAHVGKKIEMDQYAPKDARLTYSRRGGTVKGVTEKFEFLNTNLFEIFSAAPLFNSSSDKTAKYPRSEYDKEDGSVDLMHLKMVNTRNKNGPSGINFNLIVSQSRGFNMPLTNFFFCKERGNVSGYSK